MDYNKYSDVELVALLREGNPTANEAFNIIYMKYSAKVYGYCLFRAGSESDAKELMQETWIKFFQSAKNSKAITNILPYLFKIAANLAINYYRSKKSRNDREISIFDPETIEMIADPYNFQSEMEKDEILGLIKIAVNSLGDIYKETFLLYWFGDLKFSEIAQVLNESEAAIRKRYERAMHQMNNLLKPYLI